jgi:tetrapyrrole methylase family protein/MazG family protein
MTDYLESFKELAEILARLRAPDGCPWDREQTHASLRGGLLEECYEVLDAIDEREPAKLREELGDLLLHIVFQAQIAAEMGEFSLDDVIRGINRKLISRHPHIFASEKLQSAGEVAAHWEKLKQAERGAEISALDSVPASLPALAYSRSVQARAAGLGFDWEDTSGVIEKLAEEVSELRNAGDEKSRESEFGDLLFTLVNVGRWLKIDAETALRGANRKFSRRFQKMEEMAHRRGQDFSQLSLEEKDALWEEAKRWVG